MVFLKEILKVNFEKSSRRQKIMQKLPSMQIAKSYIIEYMYFTLLHTYMFGYIAKCITTSTEKLFNWNM